MEDVLLSSPSAAAAFVGGTSSKGNELWKTEDGITLKNLEYMGDQQSFFRNIEEEYFDEI